jgi:hypothetical protein
LFVIIGEPGIGKTLLLGALAAQAEGLGARVARGGGWESGGAPAYWPWIQALGGLCPDVAGLLGDQTTGVVPAEPESARFALFRSVASRLAALAAEGPLLLSFDDLHAADVPSLLLLHFVARQLPGLPVLILGTCREAEASATNERARLIDELARDGRRLPLRGLGEAAVARIVERRMGRRMSLALVRRVHVLTEGNPLFVEEVTRLRAAEAAAGMLGWDRDGMRIPRSVRDTLRRRVELLPADAIDVVAVAAVAGRDFDVAQLVEVSGLPENKVGGQLKRAVGAGVLESVGEAGYRFAHELFRQVLWERLEGTRRATLHLGFARLIEAGPEAGGHLSELAHHYRQALPAIDVAVAVDWSLRAARAALGALAYEEAAVHAEAALALGATGRERVQLLLLLGESRLAGGEPALARAPLVRASRLARELGAPELLARTALALGGGHAWAKRSVDRQLVHLLEEAAAGLRAGGLRARLLARLAEELLHDDAQQSTAELSREAVTVAREAADDGALARALEARLLTTLRATTPAERAALATELQAIAERTMDAEALHTACLWNLNLGLERGDRKAVERARAGLRDVVVQTRQPHQLWNAEVTDGMLALLEGRLDAAERHLAGALSAAEGVVPLAAQMHAIQLIALRREQGRLAELAPAAREFATGDGSALSWRCAWIGMLCELGREEDAERELIQLPAGILTLPNRRNDWEAVALMLAEICSRLHDQARAQVLYSALTPYAGQVAVVSFSVLCRGAIDRYLGLLAGTLGHHADAEHHFDAAQALHAGLGSALWTARTEVDRAAVRAQSGDLPGARAAAQAALAHAADRDLVAVAHRARTVLDQCGAPGPAVSHGAAGAEILLFVREGGLWTIGDPEVPVRLPDARGLRYIADLLAHPGEEKFAVDLAGGFSGSEQAVLDSAAKSAYRTRLEDLRVDIDEAERFGDHERASRARAELDAVISELSRAVGLRGRDRSLAGPAERARSSVTKAIRAAIAKIAARDPALAAHLDGAIRTGTFCRYVPDARHPIQWKLTM